MRQVARSILLEALEGSESMTRSQIAKDLRQAESEFRRELPKLGLKSDRATDMAFLMLNTAADCVEMGCFGPNPSEMPSGFMEELKSKFEKLTEGAPK